VLATNYGYWEVKENSSNLPYLLKLAKNAEIENLPAGLPGYIKKLERELKDNPDATSKRILDVLKKTELQELPKFDDIPLRIIEHLKNSSEIGDANYVELGEVSKSLVNKMFEASSLAHDGARQLYFAMLNNPEHEMTNMVIQSKRISKDIVNKIISDGLSNTAVLQSIDGVNIRLLPKGVRKLEIKTTNGGISARNIDLMKDHKFSTELLLTDWMYKYTPDKANERFDQVSLIINGECQEEYDLLQSVSQPFGTQMLNGVRQRLRSRLDNDPNEFFNCKYEHLLGSVGILTEMCKVWWSDEFDIQEEISE